MQIIIDTKDINKKEKKYILNLIFSEFLNFDNYKINFKKKINCFKVSYNGTQFTLPDTLLSKSKIYSENYVKEIRNFDFEYDNLFHKSIPFLFYSLNNNLTYKIDIFGSVFFFLSGMEFYNSKFPRDEFNRYDLTQSIIYKNNLQKRALVNEYIFLLKNFFLKNNFKPKKYKLIISHDIDRLFSYNENFITFSKSLLADLVIRKSLILFIKRLLSKFFAKFEFSKKIDPYNSLDYLINFSKKNNLKSQFNFMVNRPDNKNNLDSKYKIYVNNFFRSLFSKIIKNDCKVGFHGSLDSNSNEKKFINEINVLNEILNSIGESKIDSARQHYLYHNLDYFNNANKYGIINDSSIGYEINGFWSQCCYKYPIFDIRKRKQLKVYQSPLILMDVNLDLKNIDSKKNLDEIFLFKSQTKHYGGNLSFLFHNNYLRTNREKKNYEYLIKILK